ncbi:MAG: ABC transporter permease [Bifidobacteriaceae bacterium]|nr:ABC transporter permease [Bifidobacteriaceae bacterium]
MVAVVLYLFFAVVSSGSGFTSLDGTAAWVNGMADLGMMAMPVALLMISGELDLSVGSVVGAGSVTVGLMTGYFGLPLGVALVAGLAIGLTFGLANGLLVTKTGMPSFIVTLGMMLIVLGLGVTIAQALTKSTTLSVLIDREGVLPRLFASKIGDSNFDVSIVWFICITMICAWVLRRSRFGNWILATGGDTERARRSGVLTNRVKITLFACAGMSAVFVGMMQAVKFSTADPTTGSGYVFDVPIVVIIGGVLITGGYGSITGVFFGILIYGISKAGLFYAGWDANLTQVLLGALLLVAVISNNRLRKMALSPPRFARRPPVAKEGVANG